MSEHTDMRKSIRDMANKAALCSCITKSPEPEFHAKYCPVAMKAEIQTLKEKVRELENPWISVEDRLPEISEDVLGTGFEDTKGVEMDSLMNEYGYEPDTDCLEIGFRSAVDNKFNPNEWCDFSFTVTHWMPLPKPPTKDKQGE